MPGRTCQLIAEAVAVCCPFCQEAQPSPDNGSEYWTAENFEQLGPGGSRRNCVSCDRGIIILKTRPKFQ